ncbi:MAG: hypothetical protein IBJ10_01165 [Phycisphaerales bacterium]|nr:hypothetical protein [Phycisphaerales bacterium]
MSSTREAASPTAPLAPAPSSPQPAHSVSPRPAAPVFRDLPRIVVTTPRLDNRADWKREPDTALVDFTERVEKALPGVDYALCLKAPANGRGVGTWHDQWSGLTTGHHMAIRDFAAYHRSKGRDLVINTCPPDPVPLPGQWPTWAYVETKGATFLLDSTAHRIGLARQLAVQMESRVHNDRFALANGIETYIVTGDRPSPTLPHLGVEGWGDPANDWPGFAAMSWAKVEQKFRDQGITAQRFQAHHDLHRRRRYLITRAANVGEIPVHRAAMYLDRGYGLWVLAPSAGLKALIVDRLGGAAPKGGA